MDENCCENPDIKLISGNHTCIKCGIVHGPHIVHGWTNWDSRKVVLRKSIYNRTAHVKNKLNDLQLSSNELNAFIEAWTLVEAQLKKFNCKRFPKLEFFINKTLKCLGIDKYTLCKISPALQKKYEIMWKQIV